MTAPYNPPSFVNGSPPYINADYFNALGDAVKRSIDAINTSANDQTLDRIPTSIKSSNYSMTVDDIGTMVIFDTSNIPGTITLPPIADVSMGAVVSVYQAWTGQVTVDSGTADGIFALGGAPGSVKGRDVGALLQFVKYNDTYWLCSPVGDSLDAETTKGGNAPGNRWVLGTRTALPDMAVPSIRPKSGAVAFDIMPKAGATEVNNEGYAWLDVCDTDCLDNDPAVGVARVGIKSDRVEFGSKGFEGATGKPVSIIVDGTEVARFTSSGLDALNGLSIVTLTESQYDALSVKDPNTLYLRTP
jgi:hypothetical protein